jgi:hypothetical protein
MKTINKHKIGAISAMFLILVFQSLTIISDIWGSQDSMILAKKIIAWCIPFLIASLIITGISGKKLAGQSQDQLILRKQKRTQLVAAVGLLVLLPSAYFLLYLASNEIFSILFWSIQTIEIVAGLFNFTLLFLNAKDGREIGQNLQNRISGRNISSLIVISLMFISISDILAVNIPTDCVAYNIKKDIAIVTTVNVEGLNCDQVITVNKEGSKYLVSVMIPVDKFDSGNKKRDEAVRELLGEKLFFQAIVNQQLLMKDKFTLRGVLNINNREYPIKFQVVKSDKVLNGLFVGTLSGLGIEPPRVGPGAVIAKSHDTVELYFRITAPPG